MHVPLGESVPVLLTVLRNEEPLFPIKLFLRYSEPVSTSGFLRYRPRALRTFRADFSPASTDATGMMTAATGMMTTATGIMTAATSIIIDASLHES